MNLHVFYILPFVIIFSLSLEAQTQKTFTANSTHSNYQNYQTQSYQEVTYDDLLQELSQKSALQAQSTDSPFDAVTIHAGIGYVNAYTSLQGDPKFNLPDQSFYQNGLQLSLGVDLFSPYWYSEGIFRNFGVTTYGKEEITLREMNLKIGYKNYLTTPWYYSFATGLSDRYLKYKNLNKKINLEESTPSWIFSAGLFIKPQPQASLGVELSGRSAFINNTIDQTSVDLAFRLITHF